MRNQDLTRLIRKLQATDAPPVSSLSDRVYRAFKRDIVTGVFRSGEAMSEGALARRYGGSRTPVREAAVRLQQENLLRIIPNRGYFVAHLTIAGLNELYEYRVMLEGTCAELAAKHEPLQPVMQLLEQLAAVPFRTTDRAGYLRFIEGDTAFHVGIAKLTRNPLLVRAVSDVRCQMERIMYASIDIGYYGEVPVREHRDILSAIRERQPEEARRLMQQHIVLSKDKVLQLAHRGSRVV